MSFPAGFLWGASTAAYQVEGGNRRSAFWDWERRHGWEPCGPAVNSWEMWRDDLRCLQQLNLRAYRFSVEWSRVEPYPGDFDEAALERYLEMARALNRAGIRPIVCLHHFSEPVWLFERYPKGWLSSGAADEFIRFTNRVVLALRTEVRDWITFNEPMVWLLYGYGMGRFPPGMRRILSLERTFYRDGLLGNVLRAHNEAYRIIHRDVDGARVAVVQNVTDLEPARPGAADLEAMGAWDRFMHGKFLDMAHGSGALDFLGLNYYTRIYVRASRVPGMPWGALPAYAELEETLGPRLFRWLGGRRGDRPRTDMGWEIVPEGLGRVVGRLWEAYRLPILVTENGIANASGERREDFLREHLRSLLAAIQTGAKVEGYLHWSLLDNYEWGSFKPKFGLFRVNRKKDFRRMLALGGRYYAQVARRNAL
ncbi:MAG: family 1 glycosylhydrolase [Elusimicrobiota bacterium]